MPYKNPEHKRKWEREHRAQRNAQRKMKRLEGKSAAIARNPAADPTSNTKPTNGWKGLIGLAIGLGVVLFSAIAGTSATSARPFRESA